MVATKAVTMRAIVPREMRVKAHTMFAAQESTFSAWVRENLGRWLKEQEQQSMTSSTR